MKKQVSKTSNVFKVESEKIEDLFTHSFKEAVNDSRGAVSMDELECAVEKDIIAEIVKVNVTVYGLAGTTSKSKFHNKKTGKVIEGFNKIKVGNYSFKFDSSYDLNTNDYVLVYVNE
jgi:hypothetical protein